jgi:hypothetical protein
MIGQNPTVIGFVLFAGARHMNVALSSRSTHARALGVAAAKHAREQHDEQNRGTDLD